MVLLFAVNIYFSECFFIDVWTSLIFDYFLNRMGLVNGSKE